MRISPSGQKHTMWSCNCDCGKTGVRKSTNELRNNNKIKSCGCKRKTNLGNRTSYLIGEKYKNNNEYSFEIVGYTDDNRRRNIKFDSGYEDIVLVSQIRNGKVRDLNEKTYYGVGCLGMKYATNHWLFTRWLNMVGRCYNPKHSGYKSYGAKGVYVSDELLNFKNYVDFVEHMNNFSEMKNNPLDWDIDKDELSENKKYYGKDTIKIMLSKENLEIENKDKRIPLLQMKDNIVVAKYNSISEAEVKTGIPRGNIARSVRDEKYKAGGHDWRKQNVG